MELLLYLFENPSGLRYYDLISPEDRLQLEEIWRSQAVKFWFIERIDVRIPAPTSVTPSLRARLAHRIKRWLRHAD